MQGAGGDELLPVRGGAGWLQRAFRGGGRCAIPHKVSRNPESSMGIERR